MRGPSEGGGPPRAAIQRGPCPKILPKFDRRPLAGARGRLCALVLGAQCGRPSAPSTAPCRALAWPRELCALQPQDVTRAVYTLLCCICLSTNLIHGFSPTRRWPVLQTLVVLTSLSCSVAWSIARTRSATRFGSFQLSAVSLGALMLTRWCTSCVRACAFTVAHV